MTTTENELMDPAKIFEVINDFLSFGGAGQILGLCTDLEVIYLPILGIDKFVSGERAPEALRQAIRERVSKNLKWSDRIELNAQFASAAPGIAVYYVTFLNGTVSDAGGVLTVMSSIDGIRGLIQTSISTMDDPKAISQKEGDLLSEMTDKKPAKRSKAEPPKVAKPKLVEVARGFKA